MRVLKNPDMYCDRGSTAWVDWIGMVKDNPRFRCLDVAIELKEDYDANRVVLAAGFALLIILILTAVWLVKGGDASYVSGVMSYVLTFVGGMSYIMLILPVR
jgi:ABC-type enterochelin transport system permease subunit